MVAECGMSAAIGPVYVAAMHDERHGGGGVSEATRQRVDAEVRAGGGGRGVRRGKGACHAESLCMLC